MMKKYTFKIMTGMFYAGLLCGGILDASAMQKCTSRERLSEVASLEPRAGTHHFVGDVFHLQSIFEKWSITNQDEKEIYLIKFPNGKSIETAVSEQMKQDLVGWNIIPAIEEDGHQEALETYLKHAAKQFLNKKDIKLPDDED
jgi:hypothetical protein